MPECAARRMPNEPPGRSQGEYRSAQHGGCPMSWYERVCRSAHRFILRLPVAATLLAGAWLVFHAPTQAQTQIARTKHNLTASGPGTVRTAEAAGTCVFCHTPHNANPTRWLWNRDLPAVTYQLYASSTLQAQLDQPTGSTRLCLSCHDGLLAVGNLRVAPKGAPLAIGPL